jgi:hypothetical protein
MSSENPFAGAMQFDAAEPAAGATALTCTRCSAAIQNVYHQAGGQVVCSLCRTKIEAQAQAGGDLGKAALFGAGAAAVGAAIYYGFAILTDSEWALIAILVGFMVGKAVNVGSGGRGGALYQGTAVALTYAAIVAAYAGLVNHATNGLAVAVMGWFELFMTAAKAPFQDIDPINLLIIGVGLFQAWSMNRAAEPVAVSGPYSLAPKAEAGLVAGE